MNKVIEITPTFDFFIILLFLKHSLLTATCDSLADEICFVRAVGLR
jgi:hypothetical protein